MLKNKELRSRKRSQSSSKINSNESELRKQIESLMRKDPNALVSKEYQNLMDNYGKSLITDPNKIIQNERLAALKTKIDNLEALRKEKVMPKTALSQLFGESDKEESNHIQQKPNQKSKIGKVGKGILIYLFGSILIWIIRVLFN